MDQYITRADKLIEELKNKEIYSDFSNSFIAHPITKKLFKLTNEADIKQSFRNRLLTNFSEKLYDPNFGSNIRKSLFEPNDNFIRESVDKAVRNSAQNDQRISILNVEVYSIGENSISISVYFLINNIQEVQSINLILRRV